MATEKKTLKQWFSNFKKPTQEQFWAWLDSFWHKSEKIPMAVIEDLESSLEKVATSEQLNNHESDLQAHSDLFAQKVDKEQGKGLSTNDFTDAYKQQIDDLQLPDLTPYLLNGGYDGTAQDLKNAVDLINAVLQSDDSTLDELQEIVNYIKMNKSDLQNLSINNIAGLVEALASKSDVNHVHSYNDLTDKPIIPEAYNVDACSVYDYSKITDLEYNKNLSTGKYISTDNNGKRLILLIHNYPDGENTEIPVVQMQIMFQHGTTAMPNLRWVIKQTNGSYAFSNGGSWFQFASTHYVSSRAFVHHAVNPTETQLNGLNVNGNYSIQNFTVNGLHTKYPTLSTTGNIVHLKNANNQYQQIYYPSNGEPHVTRYYNGSAWSEWFLSSDVELNVLVRNSTLAFNTNERINGYSLDDKVVVLINGSYNITVDNGTKNRTISFQKTQDETSYTFMQGTSNLIIADGTSVLNGKKGSTATLTFYDTQAILRISNIE